MAMQITPQPRPGSDNSGAAKSPPRMRGMTPPPPPAAARTPMWESNEDATRKAPLPLALPRPRAASNPPPFPAMKVPSPIPGPPKPVTDFNPFDDLNLAPESPGPRSTVPLPFARPTLPDMMSAPPPPSIQPQSALARQAARLDRSEFETETIPVARLRRLRQSRRLGWLMTGLFVAGLAGTIAVGLEERQRLMADLKAAKLSRIETEHAQASLVRRIKEHDAATAALRASIEKREAELHASATPSPERLTLVDRLRKELDKKETNVDVAGNVISVSVLDRGLFSNGTADLSTGGARTLTRIATHLKETKGQRIVVDGHTDDKRPTSRSFPSNWELSALRAVAVVRFLVEDAGLDPTGISAAAHSQFAPRGKHAEKNRRIEIRLEPSAP